MADNSISSRLEAPKVPKGKIVLQPPPELEASDGVSSLLMSLVPMLGTIASIVMMSMTNNGITGLLTGGMFLFSSLGFVLVNGFRQRSQRKANLLASRREYLTYLAGVRKTVRVAGKRQRNSALWNAPDPESLVPLAEEPARRWERVTADEDFLDLRIGLNDQDLCLALEAPELPPLAQLDPVSASAANRFMLSFSKLKDMPVTVNLTKYRRVELLGSQSDVESLARSILCQAACWHAPDLVRIMVLASPERLHRWQWVRSLPHARPLNRKERVMVTSSCREAETMLGDDVLLRNRFIEGPEHAMPHIIIVNDGIDTTKGPGASSQILADEGLDGVTVITMPDEWDELTDDNVLRVLFSNTLVMEGLNHPEQQSVQEVEAYSLQQKTIRVRPDHCAPQVAAALASRLVYVEQEEGEEVGSQTRKKSSELVDLLGIGDIRHLDLDHIWSYKRGRERLRVPIGLNTEDSAVTYLDIKEAAQFGMGPHGVLVGATGSGKSEVLRTLVLSLVLSHSPDQLNLVLIDFKGGATFAGMEGMPHISSIITNLGEEASLVDRMQEALQGELTRRQELLRQAGNFANVTDYEKARLNGRDDLEPLPALLVIVDEFSELLTAKPDIVDSFVGIGRLGRSLEVHLLIASQRLEEGRLRGLDSHLSYRIGLKTFSTSESRAVLGVPDAYNLPNVPGTGYLKADANSMVQFRASYVSGPPKGMDDTSPSNLDYAVQQMRGKGHKAHAIWLEPLHVPSSLDALMGDLTIDPNLGLVSPRWRQAGALTVPCAIVDKPLEQRREILSLDLAGAGGHVAVAGGPLSGKSTFLRTMVSAMALTHTPAEVQFYVMDFGGGSFAGLERMAHVSGVAMHNDDEVIRRMVDEITGLIDGRERYFKDQGIESMSNYRTRRARGEVDDGYGDVFLVVDGWGVIRSDFEDLEERLQQIIARGLTYGVHLMASVNRWMELRANVSDLVETKLELRLGDPSDSVIDRHVAVNVPKGLPGRGLDPTKHHMMVALPRIDGGQNPADLADGVSDMVSRINQAWTGDPGPKLRLLPTDLPYEDFSSRIERPEGEGLLAIGINGTDLNPVFLNAANEPNLYLFGESKSGKSSFIRLIMNEVAKTYTPERAKIFLVDYRRANLGEIPEGYEGEYLKSHGEASQTFTDLAEYLRTRLPGQDVTAKQLRDRSWWKGSEVFILVDDYDLVASSQGNPLSPLVPYLTQATDIGLHLIIARRTGGASRALFDPILQSMQDLGTTGILLSGDPSEGQLIGKVKPKQAVPGRAQVVSRDLGLFEMQIAYVEPME